MLRPSSGCNVYFNAHYATTPSFWVAYWPCMMMTVMVMLLIMVENDNNPGASNNIHFPPKPYRSMRAADIFDTIWGTRGARVGAVFRYDFAATMLEHRLQIWKRHGNGRGPPHRDIDRPYNGHGCSHFPKPFPPVPRLTVVGIPWSCHTCMQGCQISHGFSLNYMSHVNGNSTAICILSTVSTSELVKVSRTEQAVQTYMERCIGTCVETCIGPEVNRANRISGPYRTV